MATEQDRILSNTMQYIRQVGRKPYVTKTDLKKLIRECKIAVELIEKQEKAAKR